MEAEAIAKTISTLGFPVAAAVGMAWFIYRLGVKLTEAHATFLIENTTEMKKQTALLGDIKSQLPTICNATCDNFKPRTAP